MRGRACTHEAGVCTFGRRKARYSSFIGRKHASNYRRRPSCPAAASHIRSLTIQSLRSRLRTRLRLINNSGTMGKRSSPIPSLRVIIRDAKEANESAVPLTPIIARNTEWVLTMCNFRPDSYQISSRLFEVLEILISQQNIFSF